MFNQLKLRNRILLGYSVPIALALGVAGLVFGSVKYTEGQVSLLETKHIILETAKDADDGVNDMLKAARIYLIKQAEQPKRVYQGGKEGFQEAIEKLKELVVDDQQKENLTRLTQLGAEVDAHYSRLIALVDAGKANEAIQIERQGESLKQVKELEDIMTDLEERAAEILEMQRKNVDGALGFLVALVTISAVISALLSVAIAYWLSASISNEVSKTVTQVASASTEIAATVQQQERTIAQQASSVNETTTTMEELGASSRQAAEQAEASASGAREALAIAENGSQAVQQTMEGMNTLKENVRGIAEQIMRLSEQTGQIANISDLVADIANQTNMLALNAAVEAARAGEQGKGFSVVASEIRKLADESKKSAEKINVLVTDLQASMNSTVMVTDEGTKKTDESIRLAQGTAQAFIGVTEAVNNVFVNSQQISLSSKQQAVAVQQVIAAMNAINLGAQETSAGINQVRVSTEQLNAAAKGLQAVV
jgi:methyl-accepting chemotaxis protein